MNNTFTEAMAMAYALGDKITQAIETQRQTSAEGDTVKTRADWRELLPQYKTEAAQALQLIRTLCGKLSAAHGDDAKAAEKAVDTIKASVADACRVIGLPDFVELSTKSDKCWAFVNAHSLTARWGVDAKGRWRTAVVQGLTPIDPDASEKVGKFIETKVKPYAKLFPGIDVKSGKVNWDEAEVRKHLDKGIISQEEADALMSIVQVKSALTKWQDAAYLDSYAHYANVYDTLRRNSGDYYAMGPEESFVHFWPRFRDELMLQVSSKLQNGTTFVNLSNPDFTEDVSKRFTATKTAAYDEIKRQKHNEALVEREMLDLLEARYGQKFAALLAIVNAARKVPGQNAKDYAELVDKHGYHLSYSTPWLDVTTIRVTAVTTERRTGEIHDIRRIGVAAYYGKRNQYRDYIEKWEPGKDAILFRKDGTAAYAPEASHEERMYAAGKALKWLDEYFAGLTDIRL